MGSLNQWTGIGNLGRDCELRYTPSGAAVNTFNMACSETWNDKEGAKKERTEWVRIVVWGKPAESLEPYLRKGKQVAVVGKLQTKKWKDKDGHDRYTTEIHAQSVVLLGGGKRADEDEQPSRHDEAGSQEAATDDDIPF